jgi:hypothetical protein
VTSVYTTPDLEHFEVSWHIDPDNVPRPVSEDFLAEKFMEDVRAGFFRGAAPSFTITEVRVPFAADMVDTLVEITFHIVATVSDAKTIQAYDFEIHPMRDNLDGWEYPNPGMTWGELRTMINTNPSLTPEAHLPKEVRLTDDNDPHAPWFRMVGIKSDDDGIFIAIEEIQP